MKKQNPKGAGRKQKFKEPSGHITLRVPASKKEYIKKLFNRYLTKYFYIPLKSV